MAHGPHRARNLSGDLARTLAQLETRYRDRHPRSARRHENATRHLPGGNTRTVLHYSPFPLTFAGGRGNRLTDIDGFQYLDLLGEYSAGLYGHTHPLIQAAMKRAIEDGLTLGGPNMYEARLAEAIRARFASLELMRFTNSGTEANLMALSAARALRPARPRVLAFNGGYHGGVFCFRHGGSRLNVPFNWLIGDYNDIEGTRALLRSHADEVAAVIVEPMLGGGCIPATRQFLGMLREECTAHDCILIFDEVMTSRLSPSGLQGLFDITPDMTTLGKYLGGGASFGAFGGRRDIMEHFDPDAAGTFEHAGTFNNNVLSMAAGLTGLTEVFTAPEARRINALGDRLREGLIGVASSHAVPFGATGLGSLIGLHFGGAAAETHADAGAGHDDGGRARRTTEALFHLEMLERGFYFARRGYIALSLPTTESDCDDVVRAADDFFAARGSLIRSALA
ncbi:MAG: aminotransferase class III-fold pyridoxal phosphate-dependent enzyme [Steroidobacteraceae bacterium]